MNESIISAVALLFAGTLVGNELAIGFFVHPQLWKLPDPIHAASAKAFAKVLGARMPFWYALTLILTGTFAYSLHRRSAGAERLAWASSGLWLAAILFTLIFPLPVNTRVANFDLERLPADWKLLRQRWDRYHLIRNLIITVALILLIFSAVQCPSPSY